MSTPDPAVVLGPALFAALEKKGFTQLTAIQLAVLDPAAEGRDLRITSQTGSGKTVAFGFALRNIVVANALSKTGIALPRALVVTPTRELAKQVEAELSWLLSPLGVRTASVIGGANYRDERRALAQGPAVVVGTPGRLCDHLDRGSIDPSAIAAVVLDEADRMLDMGFREELEAILAKTPKDRLTHLASATFPREVRALADRVQKNAFHLEGTRLGVANVDIDHVIHLVDHTQRLDAIVNLLAANPEARSLVFAKTRLDVTHIATELDVAGFAVGTLSGDMEQRERSRALAAFKRGQLRALVATDVAARGIDVPEVNEVIHVEAPNDADAYTHRSGRTGRAGRKGKSAILVSLRELPQAIRILKRAGVPHRFEPIPSAHEIRSSIDDRIVAALTTDDVEALEPEEDARLERLAARIEEAGDVKRALKGLLVRLQPTQAVEPRDVRRITPPALAPRGQVDAQRRPERPRGRSYEPRSFAAEPRPEPTLPTRAAPSRPAATAAAKAAPSKPSVSMPKAAPSKPGAAMPKAAPSKPGVALPKATPSRPAMAKATPSRPGAAVPKATPSRPAMAKATPSRPGVSVPEAAPSRPRATESKAAPSRPGARAAEARAPRAPITMEPPRMDRSNDAPRGRPTGAATNALPMPRDKAPDWVTFQVTWGDVHGADPRRLLALVCRRGGIRGTDVGAIRVGRTSSVVEVASHVAESFGRAARERDPRDPRVQIRDERAASEPQRSSSPPPTAHAPKAKPRGHAPPSKPSAKPSKRMRAR